MRIERGTVSARDCKVFLNGRLLDEVIWADDQAGEAAIIKRTKSGKLVMEDDRVATKIVKGRIDFRYGPDERPPRTWAPPEKKLREKRQRPAD